MRIENATTKDYREKLAQSMDRGLTDAGCIAPPSVRKYSTFKAEKPAPIDTITIPEVEVSDEDVLKYGRRVAMLLKASASK